MEEKEIKPSEFITVHTKLILKNMENLNIKVDNLTSDVGKLNTKVAILQVQRDGDNRVIESKFKPIYLLIGAVGGLVTEGFKWFLGKL